MNTSPACSSSKMKLTSFVVVLNTGVVASEDTSKLLVTSCITQQLRARSTHSTALWKLPNAKAASPSRPTPAATPWDVKDAESESWHGAQAGFLTRCTDSPRLYGSAETHGLKFLKNTALGTWIWYKLLCRETRIQITDGKNLDWSAQRDAFLLEASCYLVHVFT